MSNIFRQFCSRTVENDETHVIINFTAYTKSVNLNTKDLIMEFNDKFKDHQLLLTDTVYNYRNNNKINGYTNTFKISKEEYNKLISNIIQKAYISLDKYCKLGSDYIPYIAFEKGLVKAY
jgi:hypothetical protein